MKWTLKEISDEVGVVRQTCAVYIADLKKKRKFKKTSPGKSYSSSEVKILSKLLQFDYDEALQRKKDRDKRDGPTMAS